MLERDLLRKGKSPLEVLIQKKRFKKDLACAGNVAIFQGSEGNDDKEATRIEGISLEEAVKLNDQIQQLKPACFTVKQELNITNDLLSKRMIDVEGLSEFDDSFLRRFVGLMALYGMPVFKHGRTGRRKVLIRVDPKGMRLYWNSKYKRKSEAQTSIDFAYDARNVVRGQIFTWFRSIAIDNECCVSIICNAKKRLDLECETRDDAALLYAALKILNHARRPTD
jgi:hypothetical protein